MKSLILVLSLFTAATISMDAQTISTNALGVRFGDSDGFGAEISYQHELGDSKRLEVDLGFRNHKFYDAFKLTALHQWVMNIDGGFNWFVGLGAGVGTWNIGDKYTGTDDDGVFLNLDGNLGIEYDFDFPLLISLDVRPEFGIIGNYGDGSDFDIALGLRYQF